MAGAALPTALYEMQGGSIELQWNYSTDGHWDE